MAIAEKLSELLQRKQKLIDEVREIHERCVKEDRLSTKDEDERLVAVRGKNPLVQGGEMLDVVSRISQAERLLGLEKIGDDPRSGQDPLESRRLSDPLPHEDPVNTRNGKHQFSLLRAVHGCLPGNTFSGIEKEVSDELSARTGKAPSSFMMPYKNTVNGPPLSFAEIDRQRRAADTALEMRTGILDSTAGAGAVPTIMSKDWIEILRNQMCLMAAGATEITNLTGKFTIPRQNQASTGYWVAESGAPTASNITLDQVPFTPHTVGGYTDVSRRYFELSNIDSGNQIVIADLTAVIARAVDLAGLNGSGSSGQPLGIMQNTGITNTRTMALGTNGGVPTWAALVELFTIVARSNAATLGEFVYISNADVKGTLATTAKIGSTYPIYLLADDGTVYSNRIVWSQQVPSNLTKGSASGTLSAMIGGIFNQMILAYWSGIDIMVDPYTGSNTGAVRIVALQDMDIQVRHNEAFSFVFDMITNQSS